MTPAEAVAAAAAADSAGGYNFAAFSFYYASGLALAKL
jgi:hypothetical protein